MTSSEKLTTDPYKGVRDFYPDDWARMQDMFTLIRDTLKRYGYEEYNASPLERSELYESKTSEEIVTEQTYNFIDRGDRSVTLRPEMTPTLARMVAGKRRELALPLRWFSIPNVFRYERPQRGRLREHYQLNVDIVGNVCEEQADLEMLTIASAVLKSFGANDADFTLRVSSRKLLNAACSAAGLSGEDVRTYTRLLDRKAKMSKEEFAEKVQALTKTDPLTLIESGSDADVAKEKQTLFRLIDTLRERGNTNVQFDPEITRGFDYYTGMVFEVFDTHTDNSRALFGGGRYDKLVALFGGDSLGAVGFGMGDVTLSDFLETHSLFPKKAHTPTLFLGTVLSGDTEDSLAQAESVETIAEKLRAQGVSVFKNISNKSVGDQIKNADKRGIHFFTAVGADEIASGALRVKRLATGEEKLLDIDQVADFCIE